jgi:hypothetical protein
MLNPCALPGLLQDNAEDTPADADFELPPALHWSIIQPAKPERLGFRRLWVTFVNLQK